jgi:phosphosulfolactate synthase (CoM biosynthesis protein A)
MRCVHCYPDSGIETKKYFSDSDFEYLFQNLSSVKFEQVFISGGEPTLDNHFFSNRSRPYCVKSGSVVKTKHGEGKLTRISQKAVRNNQRARSANSRA